MFAAFFAAGWVMQYLVSTQFGGVYFARSLSSFVMGNEYGLEGNGADVLFVVMTRFILGFGCLWLPIAGVMAGLSHLFNNRKATLDQANTQPEPQTNP